LGSGGGFVPHPLWRVMFLGAAISRSPLAFRAEEHSNRFAFVMQIFAGWETRYDRIRPDVVRAIEEMSGAPDHSVAIVLLPQGTYSIQVTIDCPGGEALPALDDSWHLCLTSH